MNKLDYSVSLRAKGLSKADIITEMTAQGFDDSEIKYYLKKSDEIYLNQLLNTKPSKTQKTSIRGVKTFVLIAGLLLLIAAFYGYIGIGLLGLCLCWSLIKFGSYGN
ncbi:MAG: hypothetical protein BM564_01710 [Bacteroidetes bacterium MedPE-SWsnd-G2]|nr:MAG: hypothetical protein BM564_01710 [Bacteroidetes bacterium MedPE-SWsnd-G2]